MESEKVLMAAGVTAAVVVGAFVFWGPSGSSKLRQRRGQIAGLHNFGKTCFLNTLLQALAACPQFIAWLQLHNIKDKKSLVSSLQNVLEVVNGTHPTLRGDPYAPGAVIRALHALGWVISPEEHDAHELLLVMLSSLEEEVSKPPKIGCLSDALDDIAGFERGCSDMGVGDGIGFHTIPARPSSAMLSDFCNAEYDESTILTRYTRSEAHTPDSPHSMCTENEEQSQDGSLLEFGASPTHTISAAFSGVGVGRRFVGNNCSALPPLRQAGPETKASMQSASGFVGKRNSASYRSLERLNRGPGRVSVWGDKQHTQIPHPFRGGMGSQLCCGACGYKSTVRYDKFDSITLPLPEAAAPGLGIGNLLSDFIQPETLDAVRCDACQENTTHTKTITFSKLPACLCIHIARTTWLSSGRAHKRLDSVHFPETLSMAPYSFVQPGLNSNISTPWGSTTSLYSAGLMSMSQNEVHDGAFGGATDGRAVGSSMIFGSYTFGAMFPRNLYRLLAVIVHSGEANAGHFVTYRRGALRNSYKWYYTSDTVVREVPIEEVLNSSAYMLFYDRGSSSKYP